MPRASLIKTAEFPYHVYSRSNNREWFQLPMEEVWNIFHYYLGIVVKEFGLKIGSFVLMSNHFHMILWTPNENLDQAMHYLLREVSKKINERAGRRDHLFGGTYKWSLITNEVYLAQVYRYNCQNPLVKDMISAVQDYKFSTLYYILNDLKLNFELHEHEIISNSEYIPQKSSERLIWLNERYTDEQREAISSGTKKSIYKIPGRKFKKLFLKK